MSETRPTPGGVSHYADNHSPIVPLSCGLWNCTKAEIETLTAIYAGNLEMLIYNDGGMVVPVKLTHRIIQKLSKTDDEIIRMAGFAFLKDAVELAQALSLDYLITGTKSQSDIENGYAAMLAKEAEWQEKQRRRMQS